MVRNGLIKKEIDLLRREFCLQFSLDIIGVFRLRNLKMGPEVEVPLSTLGSATGAGLTGYRSRSDFWRPQPSAQFPLRCGEKVNQPVICR
jgi:hypothetical protein